MLPKIEKPLILAHFYVPAAVQEMADFVGDSFALAKKAMESDCKTIVFAGVSFMAESVKILCPEKTVYLPEPNAHCAMADMASEEEIKRMRREGNDLAVVTYINSSARLKALSDVIVTSANAQKIVEKLPNRNIYFIPDGNLGRYIAKQDQTGKTFFFGKGYCPVHDSLTASEVRAALSAHEGALFLTHPECREEVLSLAAYVGSTTGIISYAEKSDCKKFVVGTEEGVLYELKRRCPEKEFYFPKPRFVCEDMKMITPEKVLRATEGVPVTVDEETRRLAVRALKRMMELAK